MPTKEEHQSKARRNEKLIEVYGLAEGEFVEWAVTALFYAALHWMRALAAQEGRHITSYSYGQDSEKVALREIPLFEQSPQPFTWYRMLKHKSRLARYEMTPFSASDFHTLKRDYYDPFRQFVSDHLLT